MAEKILFVDDEPNVLQGLRRQIRKEFSAHYVSDPTTVMTELEKEGPFAVVVSDMRMPGIDGAALLRQVKDRFPDTVRVMLTGYADQEIAVSAINQGSIYSFLNKPCDTEILFKTLRNALRQHDLITAEKESIEKTLAGSVRILMELMAKSSPIVFGEAIRLRDLARANAKLLGGNRWKLDMAAMLLPIGWMLMPHGLAARASHRTGLSLEERNLVRTVPERSAELIVNIPRLEEIARIVRYVNNNFDGSGAPSDAVAGVDIPLESRILRLLRDLLAASGEGGASEEGLDRLEEHEGFYDPEMIDAMRGKIRHVEFANGHYVRDEPETPSNLETVVIDTVGQFQPGDMLVGDLRLDDGELASAKEVVLSAHAIETLDRLSRARGLILPVKVLRGASIA
jgi:response regulator RpfG family c-di-GMP phosphodiesterase